MNVELFGGQHMNIQLERKVRFLRVVQLFSLGVIVSLLQCDSKSPQEQLCDEIHAEMERLAMDRRVIEMELGAEDASKGRLLACHYLIFFRSEGHFDLQDRISEGVDVMIFLDRAVYKLKWTHLLNEARALHRETADTPAYLEIDSGSTRNEYVKYRYRRVIYRLREGYVEHYLNRGDYASGAFSPAAEEFALAISKKFYLRGPYPATENR